MFIEIAYLLKKKEKKQIIVYVIFMLIALTCSINIRIGTSIPSIASITTKLILPILKKIQEIKI